MSGWGQYPDSAYGQQQGGSQQSYGAQGQQQTDVYGNYGSSQATGYMGSQSANTAQDSSYGQTGYGTSQPSSGAVQPGYGAQQAAAYGNYQQGGQGGAVAQAAQGLAPDQQARVSQIVAQMGGSGGQQGYGSAPYQGAAQPAANTQYGGGAPQSAYGVVQPAAQAYGSSQSGNYATEQSPSGMQQAYGSAAHSTQQGYGSAMQNTQQGYGSGVQGAQQGYGSAMQSPQQGYGSAAPSSQQGYASAAQSTQQGYGSSTYGAPQQGSAQYGQQQQQKQQPSAYTAQAGYQVTPSSGNYGAQPSGPGYGGQGAVASQGYASQAGAYGTQQAGYGQQAPRTSASMPSVQQPGAMQQSAYGQQAAARPSYQAPYGNQYGATQYASQQAAPQVPAVPPVRPQQAALPSTHSTATFSRPLTQARPAATPAAAPAFGRPIVQAPAGSRVTASTRPGVQPPGRNSAPAIKAPVNPRDATAASSVRMPRPVSVGQSAREIARLADSMRDKRDESRGRDRARDADKERGTERPTVASARASASQEPIRERDREPSRPKKQQSVLKASPPPRRREPEYNVRLSVRPVTALERDYNDVIDRYPRLYVSADFAKTVSSWTQEEGPKKEKTLWPLHEPVSFQHEMDFEVAEAPGPPSRTADIRWSARVMLSQGLDNAAAKEWSKGTHHGGQHLHQLLKFLTVRHEVDSSKGHTERSGIMAIGGAHDAALDGPFDGSPRTPQALINTCIRHARDNLGIDLSSCSRWMRFLEVHYQRPAATIKPPAMETPEVTVIFMANVSTLFDKDWTSAWEEQQAWLKRKKEHDASESKKAKEAEEQKAEKAEEKPMPEAAQGAENKISQASKAAQDDSTAPVAPDQAKNDEMMANDAPVANAVKPESSAPSTVHRKAQDESAEPQLMEEKTTEDPAKEAAANGGDNEAGKEAEKEEQMPELPRLLICGKRTAKDRWRSASVSLDGLLDYDEEDREEPTLELSLFAEAFQEMLMRDFGTKILKALYTEREAALRRREERKRKREEERAAADKEAALKEAAEKTAVKEKEAAAKQEVAAQQQDSNAIDVKQENVGAEVKKEGAEEAAADAGVPALAAVPKTEETANGDGAKADEEQTGEEVKDTSVKAASAEEPTEMEVDTDEPADGVPQSAIDTATEKGKALPDVAQPVVAGGAAADSAAVKADAHINGDAAATPATDEASKPATKGDLKDDKLDKPKEKKRKYKVDEDLLQAFRYFDRNCTGYLRVDDLRRIVNNLGLALSLRTVKELCLNVAGGSSSSSRARADRVHYRDITDKEI